MTLWPCEDNFISPQGSVYDLVGKADLPHKVLCIIEQMQSPDGDTVILLLPAQNNKV